MKHGTQISSARILQGQMSSIPQSWTLPCLFLKVKKLFLQEFEAKRSHSPEVSWAPRHCIMLGLRILSTNASSLNLAQKVQLLYFPLACKPPIFASEGGEGTEKWARWASAFLDGIFLQILLLISGHIWSSYSSNISLTPSLVTKHLHLIQQINKQTSHIPASKALFLFPWPLMFPLPLCVESV